MLFRIYGCLVAHGKCIFRKCFSVGLSTGVNWFPFLFYLQIPIFRKTQRELSERETRPRAEREREREREEEPRRARLRSSSPTTPHPKTDRPWPRSSSPTASLDHPRPKSSSPIASPFRKTDRPRTKSLSSIAISPVVEPSRDRSTNRLRRSRLSSNPVATWLWFFFSGCEIIIFVWQRRKSEKMWARSRKCIFHGIFNNTTKHQKIFFTIFSQIQPNTWKYYPFRKIAFSENKYFPKNILRKPNTA